MFPITVSGYQVRNTNEVPSFSTLSNGLSHDPYITKLYYKTRSIPITQIPHTTWFEFIDHIVSNRLLPGTAGKGSYPLINAYLLSLETNEPMNKDHVILQLSDQGVVNEPCTEHQPQLNIGRNRPSHGGSDIQDIIQGDGIRGLLHHYFILYGNHDTIVYR